MFYEKTRQSDKCFGKQIEICGERERLNDKGDFFVMICPNFFIGKLSSNASSSSKETVEGGGRV